MNPRGSFQKGVLMEDQARGLFSPTLMTLARVGLYLLVTSGFIYMLFLMWHMNQTHRLSLLRWSRYPFLYLCPMIFGTSFKRQIVDLQSQDKVSANVARICC